MSMCITVYVVGCPYHRLLDNRVCVALVSCQNNLRKLVLFFCKGWPSLASCINYCIMHYGLLLPVLLVVKFMELWVEVRSTSLDTSLFLDLRTLSRCCTERSLSSSPNMSRSKVTVCTTKEAEIKQHVTVKQRYRNTVILLCFRGCGTTCTWVRYLVYYHLGANRKKNNRMIGFRGYIIYLCI